MSGEATRDVVVRVSVVGNKVDKFPDFAKMTTAAEGFLQTVESGLRILKSDSETVMAATSKLTDHLRESASTKLGDLGLGEARSAVEEMVAALDAIGNAGDIDLAGVAESASGLNDVSSAMEGIASSAGDVAREIETATGESERLAASLGDIDSSVGVDPAGVREFATETTKASSAAEDLAARLREAAGTSLGDVGLDDVKAAVQEISGAVKNVPSIDLGGGGQAKQDADEIKAAIESINEEISQSTIDTASVQEFASQAKNAADATGGFTDRLREAAGTKLGDLGIGESLAAVQEMVSSVESLGETVDSGVNQAADSVRNLSTEASLLSEETSKVSDNLRTVSETNLGDLGLREAQAAVEQMAASLAVIDNAGVGLGDTKNAVQQISDALNALPGIELSGAETAASGVNDVQSAIESLAASGQKVEEDLSASLVNAAQEAERLAQAELDAKYEVEDATKAAKAATQDEGKVAQEVAFKKIAMQNQLSAQQQKATAEALKAENDKADAFKKSSDEQRTQMLAASGAIAQALAVSKQFVATLQTIGGDSRDIQELASQFSKVEGAIQDIASGSKTSFQDLTNEIANVEASLRSVYEGATKNFGFNDISAAADELASVQRELSSIDMSGINAGDATEAVERLVQLEREVINLTRQISAQEVGNLGFGKATTAANGLSEATEEVRENAEALANADVKSLGLPTAAAAAQDLSDKVTVVVENLTNAALALTSAGETAASTIRGAAEEMASASSTQKAAVEELGQATATEGQSAAEIAFKKIALAERLAAHTRKNNTEQVKQENEKKEAAKRSGEEQQRQMFAATGALAQSVAAGTQFVSLLRMIGGEGENIDELARKFAVVQSTVQGIAAGTQAFNSLNQGLDTLHEAAAAATSQLAATGGTATVTQTALIRLAPAAATAQAALGPIGLAIAGISLAVAAVKAASDYFSEELPDDSERNAKAFERVNNQLAMMKRQIDSNARSMEAQNNMLKTELDLRNQISGKTTDKDIQEGLGIEVKTATDTANAATQTEQNAAAKRMAELQNERRQLVTEQEQLVQQDQTEKSWWGGDGKDPKREEEKKRIQKRLEEITPQILDEAASAEGVGVELTPSTMAEYAAAIENLPQEQQAAYEQVLDKFAQQMSTAIQSANQQLEASLRENQQALNDNSRSVEDARKAYEEEQNIALRLQSSPQERKALEQSVNTATATGNLNAGIDAVSGVVSTEREQELRNQLAQGNLTREKLLAEIADAAEFETEKAELEKQVAALKEQATAIQATREELTKAQQKVK